MKYKSELYIIPHQQIDNNGNVTGDTSRINIPVHSFEVDGGANRKIELGAIDEISVASEFEQARMNKNVIFYVPPTRDFLSVKLLEMGKAMVHFDITFVINMFANGRLAKALRFSSDGAWFFRGPTIEAGKHPLLKVWIRFNNIQLLHGQLDMRLRKFVNRAI